MLVSLRQDQHAAGNPPGLLAWQAYFLAYCAGIWSLRHPEPALALAVALGLGLALARARDRTFADLRQTLVILGLTALSFAAGATHARLALPEPPARPATVADGHTKALLRGQVAEVSDKPFGRVELLLRDVRVLGEAGGEQGESVLGLVSLDWDESDYRPAPGQELEARLRLWPVHGFRNRGGADFDWQQRLRGVFHRSYARGALAEARFGPRPMSFWWDAREELRGRLLRLLPESQGGAVVLGLLTGERSRIGKDVTEELRAAGLAHTLALSGLNVVYVAVLGWGLAWLAGLAWPGLWLRLPRQKLAVLLSLPLVAAYVWMGQGSPSLVRSACMFAFWGLLFLFDRGRALVDGLFLALALMVLAAPLSVYDVGLQMSALSVAGLALLFPWLRGLAPVPGGMAGRVLGPCRDALAMSLAANLALLPVIVWYFGLFSPNFLLNLPWVPVQGLVVQTLGMVGMGLALVPGLDAAAGALLGAAAWVQQAMLDALHHVALAGWLPVWALLRPRWPELVGAGLVIAAAPYCLRRPAMPLAVVLAGLLLAAAPHVQAAREDMRDEVRLTVLDVGQSQALLVTAPGGRRCLVDGGGTASRTFDMGRSVVAPALAWGRPPVLDAVALSHPDNDHAQGLAHILRHFRVGRFITNGQWPEGDPGQVLAAAAGSGGLRPETFRPGDSLDLGSGVRLTALHPAEDFEATKPNERSLVLRLTWNGAGLALLPGDVQRAGIERMVDAGMELRAQVLVLPHHGSKSSLSGMLYEAVAPAQAVVSCGHLNQFRFPNQAVADELARRGIPLASSSESGMLEVVFSPGGETIRLEAGAP